MGTWISRVRDTIMQGFILLAVAVASAYGAAPHHAPAYGYAPEFYCRDTNTSVYAEVCVPAFADQVTPVELAVKEVADEDYCFDRVLTVCELTTTAVDREICTYVYEKEDVTAPCTTTQVTYEDKSETMKVTTCGAAGYGYGHHGYAPAGEHQVCHEEYQTQAYKVPLVTAPLAYPAPKKVCVTYSIDIDEVKCEDKIENRCFNEPKCDQVTLSLPTQTCSKAHHAPVHHAPAYHGK